MPAAGPVSPARLARTLQDLRGILASHRPGEAVRVGAAAWRSALIPGLLRQRVAWSSLCYCRRCDGVFRADVQTKLYDPAMLWHLLGIVTSVESTLPTGAASELANSWGDGVGSRDYWAWAGDCIVCRDDGPRKGDHRGWVIRRGCSAVRSPRRGCGCGDNVGCHAGDLAGRSGIGGRGSGCRVARVGCSQAAFRPSVQQCK
jgi:hypothetical protein